MKRPKPDPLYIATITDMNQTNDDFGDDSSSHVTLPTNLIRPDKED